MQLQKWPGWEDLTDEDDRAHDILFSYTGFPSVSPEAVREQLQYLADHGPEATSKHIMDSIDLGMDNIHKMDAFLETLYLRQWYKDAEGNYQRKGFEGPNPPPYAFTWEDLRTTWRYDKEPHLRPNWEGEFT